MLSGHSGNFATPAPKRDNGGSLVRELADLRAENARLRLELEASKANEDAACRALERVTEELERARKVGP